MKLRVRVRNLSKILTIPDDSTLQDLNNEIAQLISSEAKEEIVKEKFKTTLVKYGYPPKSLKLDDITEKLTDLGLKSGESLIITTNLPPVSKPNDNDNSEESKREKNKPTVSEIKNSKKVLYIKLPSVTPTAYLVLRPIPDDNSCLFSSISYSFFGPKSIKDPSQTQQLRQIVSSEIKANKEGLYSKAVLDGKTINEYANWICKPTSWGGAIELKILSEYLGICIWSVDVETNRIYKFNEKDGLNVIVLCYSGIHYDSISLSYSNNLDFDEDDIVVFSKKNNQTEYELMDSNLLKLIDMLKQMGYFTNTSNFKIKCQVCNSVFKGEKEASQHASESGHYKFGEVS